MKVALVFLRYRYPSGDCPLGIAYIASALRENRNAEIDIIDTTFDDSRDRAKMLLEKKRYDIVGFSVMTTMMRDALILADFLKRVNPDCLTVFGGPHATVMPEETLRNKSVDAVVIGEGERTFIDLVENFRQLDEIQGIWFKKGDNIIKNKPRAPISNLDELAFPALDSFSEIKKYIGFWFQMDSVSNNLRGVNIIASRGCPYNCTYCQPTLAKIFGRSIRKRSPDSIIEELKHWKKEVKINAFMFQDDTFIFDKRWIEDICDKMIAENINLVWACNIRADLVSEELFRRMKKAGLRKVLLGIESGSQRVLDEIYDKQITIDQIRNATRIARRLGLKVQGYFMLGAPTETKEEIKKTIGFARKLPIDEATFSVTTPLPQTYLYDKTRHLIVKDIEDFDYYKTPVYGGSGTLNPERLKCLRREAILKFYLSPQHVLYTIKAFISPAAIKKSFVKLKRF